MNDKSIFLLLVVLLIQTSCQTKKKFDQHGINNPQKLFINHHKAVCTGEGERLCFLAKENQEQEWEYFYNSIEGFEYEWGYEFELLVSKSTIDNPPADGSSLNYRLVKVISKMAKTEKNTFSLRYAPNLFQLENGRLFLIDGTEIIFGSKEVQSFYQMAIEDGGPFVINLKQNENGGLRMEGLEK